MLVARGCVENSVYAPIIPLLHRTTTMFLLLYFEPFIFYHKFQIRPRARHRPPAITVIASPRSVPFVPQTSYANSLTSCHYGHCFAQIIRSPHVLSVHRKLSVHRFKRVLQSVARNISQHQRSRMDALVGMLLSQCLSESLYGNEAANITLFDACRKSIVSTCEADPKKLLPIVKHLEE